MKIEGLKPDPLTGLPRTLNFKGFTVDDNLKSLTIFWRLSVYRLDGSESAESLDVQQVANNSSFVNMEVFAATGQVQLLSQYELLQMTTQPFVKGEYEFWWWISDNYPQPIRNQIIDAGQKFAERNGWI